MFFRIKILLLSVLIFGVTGCASYNKGLAPPVQESQIRIDVSDKKISRWEDHPPGVYQIKESRTAISGHQNNNMLGALFGVGGVLIESAANSQKGKEQLGGFEKKVNIDLNTIINKQVSEIVNNNSDKYTLSSSPKVEDDTTLEITAGLILTFVDEEKILPFTLLKVNLIRDDFSYWNTKIYAVSGSPKPLTKEGGWIDENTDNLYESVKKSLNKSLTFLFEDMANPFPRDKDKEQEFTAQQPFIKDEVKIKALVLKEDSESYFLVPKESGLSVLGGIHILGKSTTHSVDK